MKDTCKQTSQLRTAPRVELICTGGDQPKSRIRIFQHVPVEIAQLLESNASNSSTLDSDNAYLVWQMLPGMVDDDNQPLPENIPTPADEGQESAQFFSNWEHSGSCLCCIEGGRRNKACLSFNTDVKPTIQQLFEMFFFKPYVVGVIIPQTNICLQQGKHHPISYGEFLH